MFPSDFNLLHQRLNVYIQPSDSSPKSSKLTKDKLTYIFQKVDEALKQSEKIVNKMSLYEIKSKMKLLSKIEEDVESLFNKHLESDSQLLSRKIKKFFKDVFPSQDEVEKTYLQLEADLVNLHSQLNAEAVKIMNLNSECNNLAAKWQQMVTNPHQISPLEAQKTLDLLLSKISQLLDYFPIKEVDSLIQSYPELSALFLTNNIEGKIRDIASARQMGMSVLSFISEPKMKQQIASLFGENPNDYRDIPIRANIIAIKDFSQPTNYPGFWKLKASDSTFLSLYPEIEQAFCSSTDEFKCRGLHLELINLARQEEACLKKIQDLAEKSPLPYLSIFFSHPLKISLPTTGLSKQERTEFFHKLSKLVITSPVSLKLDGNLSTEEKQCLHLAFPNVSELDVSDQPIELVHDALSLFRGLQKICFSRTKITDMDLARWQFDGKFEKLKELDLRECSLLTKQLFFPLPILMRENPDLRVHFPASLPTGSFSLPKGEDAIRLQMLLVRDRQQEIVYPQNEKHLSPSLVSLWLASNPQDLPINPHITSIDAQNLALSNAQLIELLKKFPNIQEINLQGNAQLTEEVFADPAVQTWLSQKRFLNLRGTGISKEFQDQLQQSHPLIFITDIKMIVKGHSFDFNKRQLTALSSYWHHQFSPEGVLFQLDMFTLEDTSDSSFDPEVFSQVVNLVKFDHFSKTTFSKEEAEQFFTLSQFFGASLKNKCLNVLASQIYLPTTTVDDIIWIKDLAEKYSEKDLFDRCEKQLPLVQKADPEVIKESFISPEGSMNLIVKNQSNKPPLSLVIKPEVLAKNSPVFEAMFRWEKLRENRNQLFIEEDPDHFFALCQWIEAQTVGDYIPEVLQLADKYNISTEALLQERCLKFLINNIKFVPLNIKTFEILLSGFMNGKIDQNLHESVFIAFARFIRKNLETGDFKEADSILQLIESYIYHDYETCEYFLSYLFPFTSVQEFLEEMSKKGNPMAQNGLGYCYHHGLGRKRDEVKAKEFYQLAADQKNIYGQGNLATCFFKGIGCVKDENKALEYIQNLENHDNAYLQTCLGMFYEDGIGGVKDYSKAIKYYEVAAKKGNAWAQNELGYYYGTGISVEKNEQMAREYYLRAANQGHSTALVNLGKYYRHGVGVEKNEELAREYYLMAANKGNAQGCFMMGFCYENGIGGSKSIRDARKNYQIAAEKGHAKAQKWLDNHPYF